MNGRDEVVLSQLVPVPDSVLNLPGRKSDARYEFVFPAADLPALGSRSYYVTVDPHRSFESKPASLHIAIPAPEDVIVSTDDWKLRWKSADPILVECHD